MKRTPEDACIEYALAVNAVREQTRILRENRCPHESPDFYAHDMLAKGESSCLDDFFHAPKGPDGEFPRYREFYEKMCDACKIRLQAIADRREARLRVGAAKRSIEAIGKRLIRNQVLA